jgi:hypothetical protein
VFIRAQAEHALTGQVTEEQIAIALERWPLEDYALTRHLEPEVCAPDARYASRVNAAKQNFVMAR